MKPANESRFGRWLAGLVIVASLTLVACGAAATATPQPAATAAPAATTAPAATPAPTPAPTQVPAAAVSPGKVVWMMAGLGNERFDYSRGVGGGSVYGRMMGGYLITSNENGEDIPGLATAWDISSDGLTWTFTIREGGRFHDGQEITAADVRWSLMHYYGTDASGSAVERNIPDGQVVSKSVEKVEQTGPNQVGFTTTKVFGAFYARIAETGSSWYHIVPERPLVHDDAQEAAYDKNPIGAGPIKVTRHVPADRMEFERFADYYYQPANGLPEDRRVKFTGLDLLLVPEEATRVAALRAGEADIAPISLGGRAQVEAGGGRLVFGREGIYIAARQYGCQRPEFPCNDKRVRHALSYAIDKEAMRDGLFGGPDVFGVKGWGGVTPSAIGYGPELDPFPYDPDKARQLLADAGYPDGRGFGKLIVNTWVSASMPFLPESAQFAASNWRDVLGIDVEVRTGDETALKKAEQDQSLYGQVLWRDNEARKDGTSLATTWYSRNATRKLHETPELFDLVDNTDAVFEPAAREVALNALWQRLRDEQYEFGLGYVNIPWGVGPKVVGWEPFPLAYYPTALHKIVLR